MGRGKERGKPRNRHLTTANKLMVTREEGGGAGEMGQMCDGLRSECSCRDEHWVMYEVLNYCIIHLKLTLRCMLTNWNLNKNLK